MSAIDDIAAERRRQIEVEGWSPEHDDQHYAGHLLRAAVIYAWHGTDKGAALDERGVPLSWPWDPEWWKPKDRRANLVRAGALALAERQKALRAWPHYYVGHIDQKLDLFVSEIESLDRLAPNTKDQDHG